MIPRTQLITSTSEDPTKGDCFRACVASILDLTCEEVPNFCPDYSTSENPGAWWNPFKAWLAERGLDATFYPTTDYIPPGWSIASGPTVRGLGLHSTVAAFGEVAWDPHPEDVGLTEVTDYIVIHGPDGAWTRHNGHASWHPEEFRETCDHLRVRSCGHPDCDRLDCYKCDAHDVARTDRTVELTVGYYCPRHWPLWHHGAPTSERLRLAHEAHNARRLNYLTPRECELDARGELRVISRYHRTTTEETEP